jgi:hypothetical protein
MPSNECEQTGEQATGGPAVMARTGAELPTPGERRFEISKRTVNFLEGEHHGQL